MDLQVYHKSNSLIQNGIGLVNQFIEKLAMMMLNILTNVIGSTTQVIEKTKELMVPIKEMVIEYFTEAVNEVKEGILLVLIGYVVLFTPGGVKEKSLNIVIVLTLYYFNCHTH
jgi:hypothetical protein